MGKPLTDIDTYVFGTTGIKVAAAKDENNNVHSDLYIFKQYSANSFILQTSAGVLVPGKFTLTGFVSFGVKIDSTLTGDELAETLPQGSCCIIYDNGEDVKPCVDKMLLNKIILNDGSVVFNNAV